MRLGNPSGGAAPPSKGVGELAGLLGEIKAMTPKHLAEIEKQTGAFHAARDEASERIAEADRKTADLAEAEAAHAAKVLADTEAADERQQAVSRREGECQRREQQADERERAATSREEAIGDAERRIGRVRDQLEGV